MECARVVRDRHVDLSLSCLVAYGLWLLSVGLVITSLIVESVEIGRVSLILCGAAITATVRTYCIVLGRRIEAALIVACETPQEVVPMRR